MENSKLMTPLFYDRSFNREGHKMRAVLLREISNGTQSYRLWRSAGKPDLEHPRAENDKYILYVEINGYLATLGIINILHFQITHKKRNHMRQVSCAVFHKRFRPAAIKLSAVMIISFQILRAGFRIFRPFHPQFALFIDNNTALRRIGKRHYGHD